MAKITEQAVAEVRINDTQAADRLADLSKRAKQLRGDLDAAGDSFSARKDIQKQLKETEREMQRLYAQSVNVKKVLENLNGTSLNQLQQAQRQLNAQFRAGTVSIRDYQRQIQPINTRIAELQNIMRSGMSQRQSFLSGMIGAAVKFGAAIGVAKLAQTAFNRVMSATNDMADKFEIVMAAGKAAVDSFFRSVAIGDWGNIIDNMLVAADAAAEYTKAVDELADRKISMDVETEQLRAQAAALKNTMRDQRLSNDDRIAAAKKIEGIEYKILTLRQGDLKKALDEEVKLAATQNGVGETYLKTMISQYHVYEDQINAANELINLNKTIAAAESQVRGDAELGNKALNKHNRETLESVKKAREQFLETNKEMIKFGDGYISLEKFTEQWKKYGNVVDEQRKKVADAMIAVSRQETEYQNAVSRSNSTASGLEKKNAEAAEGISTAYKDALAAAEDFHERERLLLTQQRERGDLDRETYNAKLLVAEELFLQTKLNVQKKYGESTVQTEQTIAENRIRIMEKFTPKDTDDEWLKKLESESDKIFREALADSAKELEAQADVVEKALDDDIVLRTNKNNEWNQLRQQLNIVGLDEQFGAERAKLDEFRAEGIISEEEHQKALLSLKLQYAEDYANRSAQFVSGLGSVVTGLEDLALQKSLARKNKELKAAGNNAEARAAIEAKYEKEENDIHKKYANANFAMQIAEITASTAAAAINAYASAAAVPVVGYILGPIAAAAAVAAGAIQIARAKQARDQALSADASGTASGGSRITSAGGYKTGGDTGCGPDDEPAGIVHRNEYVVPAAVIRNPAAVDHLRVLEAMRRSYYPASRRSAGFLEGGHTTAADVPSSPSVSTPSPGQTNDGPGADFQLLGVLSSLHRAVDTLNREGAKVTYERMEKAKSDADNVKYRATRK